jgi:hypothetical protein
MPPVVPAHRPVYFSPVLRAMESTSISPQFRSGTGSSIIVYIDTPESESDAEFSYTLKTKTRKRTNSGPVP